MELRARICPPASLATHTLTPICQCRNVQKCCFPQSSEEIRKDIFYCDFLIWCQQIAYRNPLNSHRSCVSIFVTLNTITKSSKESEEQKLRIIISVVDPHWFQGGSGSNILAQCGSRVLMT